MYLYEKTTITFPHTINRDAGRIIYARTKSGPAGITFCFDRENGASFSIEQFVERVRDID